MIIKNGNIHNAVKKEAFVADLIICNGDPFEISTRIEKVLIDGEIVAENEWEA